MSRINSDWIYGVFDDVSRDLTPAPAPKETRVLYVPMQRDIEVSRRCALVLSQTEKQRACRFADEPDRDQFLQRRAFRRYCGTIALGSLKPLSQIEFEETGNGRPYLPQLPNVWFSFASCRFGFLGAWSSTHGIGVDLEDQTKSFKVIQLARYHFSETEANTVEAASDPVRQQKFFQLWSLKEAALKSIGEGLPYGLDSFQFELDPCLRITHAPFEFGGPKQFTPYWIEGTKNCAALVIRNPT
jgi:phosphopantetheinyl transferase